MKKLTINRLFQLSTQGDTNLLESMEQAGILPDYQCRNGHCGACKCELVAGEVEQLTSALAPTQGNEILPCICRAKTDLVLQNVRYQNVKKFG